MADIYTGRFMGFNSLKIKKLIYNIIIGPILSYMLYILIGYELLFITGALLRSRVAHLRPRGYRQLGPQ